jgi:Rieske Fe-S protein
MNRKDFLCLIASPVLAATCKHKPDEVVERQLLLEADLTRELLTIGSYKMNATVGLFVTRKGSSNTPADFDCFWTICTHASCFVQYREQQERFVCPCHGSMFNKQGQVLQGPAADQLERKMVEIRGSLLTVFQ